MAFGPSSLDEYLEMLQTRSALRLGGHQSTAESAAHARHLKTTRAQVMHLVHTGAGLIDEKDEKGKKLLEILGS